jgi:hydrogenase maturation protease
VRADDPQLRPLHLLRHALPQPRGRAALRVVAIGVGNVYRGDDGVGLAVAERLRDEPGLDVVVVEQEPTRLLDAWAGADLALVVDAVSSGAAAGTVHRYEASDRAVPASVFRGSTHAFGVGEAIELARALGRLPARVLVYGVEGEDFSAGERLSAPVAAAVEPLVSELRLAANAAPPG